MKSSCRDVPPIVRRRGRDARPCAVIVRQGITHIVAHTAPPVGHIEITAQVWKMRREA